MGTRYLLTLVGGLVFCALSSNAQTANGGEPFHWPDGYRAAVSLSFDDARLSQIDIGLPLFKRLGVKVTFFVEPRGVQQRLGGWKQAVLDGHEIANHTLTHPCTGNYAFSGTMLWRIMICRRWRRKSMAPTSKPKSCWA